MNALLGIVRRLATLPVFGRLTSVTPLLRLSFSLRASLVRERALFVRNELRPGPVTGTYRLRESGVAVTLRHHGGDVMALDEIFSQREYDFPAPVERSLAAAERLRVVDLGANIGLFGAWLLGRFSDAHIVAFEADPETAAVHRSTIDANGLGDRWRLVEGFAGTQNGTTRFVAGLFGVSHEAKDGEGGIEVPTIDVFPELLGADFVKIDIEGAEWPIIADPRFRELRARAVVLEYHARGCSGNPRAAAENALRAGGYELVHGPQKPALGAGVLWGWRA